MVYDLIYTEKVRNQLKKLNSEDSKRIILALERCRVRPQVNIKKLVSSKYYRLKVGDYRVILDIVNKKLVIYVIELGHRRNIYKK